MQFTVPADTHVFLRIGVICLRLSFEGLRGLAINLIKEEPTSGTLFVFCNRKGEIPCYRQPPPQCSASARRIAAKGLATHCAIATIQSSTAPTAARAICRCRPRRTPATSRSGVLIEVRRGCQRVRTHEQTLVVEHRLGRLGHQRVRGIAR